MPLTAGAKIFLETCRSSFKVKFATEKLVVLKFIQQACKLSRVRP